MSRLEAAFAGLTAVLATCAWGLVIAPAATGLLLALWPELLR